MTDTSASATSPVESIAPDADRGRAEPGIALCLSGGGYRAMLFHAGALWRLYETGVLRDVDRISSVSGGSITAGVLGLAWTGLAFEEGDVTDFEFQVVRPIRRLASQTIDRSSVLLGAALPGTISDRIADAYDEYLFEEATLQDLPSDDEGPRFVINATNVQSGALWRFMKPYMRDYRVGEVPNPNVRLAVAVAASSAFPPVLSPCFLRVNPAHFTPGSGLDLQEEPFTSDILLTDGGVYDNLGLETAFKRYQTILVSDGGGKLEPEAEPKEDWVRHTHRVLNLVDNQVRSLRKRALISAFERGERSGTYWGIRTDISHYGLADAVDFPYAESLKLAKTPTRLKRMTDSLQESLINWGYAVCDAALRRYVRSDVAPPRSLPYAEL